MGNHENMPVLNVAGLMPAQRVGQSCVSRALDAHAFRTPPTLTDVNVLVQLGLKVARQAMNGGIVGALKGHVGVPSVVNGLLLVGVHEPEAGLGGVQLLKVVQLHDIGCLKVLQLLVGLWCVCGWGNSGSCETQGSGK